MANNVYIGEEKKKKSAAIRVFNVLFIIALVVGIVAFVLLLIPEARHSIKITLKEQDWAVNFAKKLNDWVKYHICDNYHVPTSYHSHGISFTSCLYVAILYFGALLGFFMMYLPFLVMHRLNKKNKKQVFRKVILWLIFIFVTLFFALIASTLYRHKIQSMIPKDSFIYSIGNFILDTSRQWKNLFAKGGALESLKLPFSSNAFAWSLFYIVVLVLIVEILLLIICSLGKAKEVNKENVGDELDEKEEENVPVTLTPTLETQTKVIPTIRELAIVNSLNPIYQSKIENLPGLYKEIQNEEIVNSLEPVNDLANNEAKEAKNVVDIADAISSNYGDDRNVQVLPGIDEWQADPWEEHDEVIEEPNQEKTVEKTEEVEEVKEETQSNVEEVKVEEVKEVNEEVIEEPIDVTSTINEQEKEVDVEEVVVEEITNDKVEEKKEETVEKTETPAYKINPVGVVAFNPNKNARKNPIGVVPVAIKKEEQADEVVEEKVEEKPQVQISAPLHSIEKSKHEKIEVVEARKVHFELKNYQIKTYQGDLSPEEAFKLGATKVQPVVNPIFANQGKEPSWKEKRRQESIRKNGYSDVTTVDTLNGKVSSSSSSTKSAISIRDLVKAKKNKVEETSVVKKEENKISKPITPISFKQEQKEVAVEKKVEVPTTQSYYHPIAPIQKKPNNKPTIKPVDPMKKSK